MKSCMVLRYSDDMPVPKPHHIYPAPGIARALHFCLQVRKSQDNIKGELLQKQTVNFQHDNTSSGTNESRAKKMSHVMEGMHTTINKNYFKKSPVPFVLQF